MYKLVKEEKKIDQRTNHKHTTCTVEANEKKRRKKSPINLTFTSKLQNCNKTTIISGYAQKVEN